MPELPEVETIKNDVKQLLLGRTVVDVSLRDPSLVRHPTPEAFVAGLRGQTMVDAGRKAKYLLIELSSGDYLAVQLMITGQFLLVQPAERIKNATRLILGLDDGRQIRLVDSNRFAKVSLVRPTEWDDVLALNRLGPDPTTPDFTLEYLASLLRDRQARLKPLLLDQHAIAGLGNIYVDEILFRARVHPNRKAGSLSEGEVAGLHAAIREIIAEAIAQRGTTIATYRDLSGRPGNYQNRLRVFRRTAQPCPRCGTPIEHTVIGGRDTHFCPACQT